MFERVIQPLLELSAPHESTKRNSDPTLPSYYTVSRAVCNYTVKLLIRIWCRIIIIMLASYVAGSCGVLRMQSQQGLVENRPIRLLDGWAHTWGRSVSWLVGSKVIHTIWLVDSGDYSKWSPQSDWSHSGSWWSSRRLIKKRERTQIFS